jgi:NAD(P)H-dependent flavin oxidoreductase YrpB (nitropropane dioxygenase family)
MAADSESSRREFLGALSAGVAVAGTLAATSEATAPNAHADKLTAVQKNGRIRSPSPTE